MKDDKYYDMYNELAGKYNYNDEESWWPDLTELSTKQEKTIDTRHKLLNILQEIASNSGFNTNAPDEMYLTANRLFDELSTHLDEKSKSFNQNKSVIKEAKWALFNKFDYMGAKELVQRIK
jgi:hypothetical protein